MKPPKKQLVSVRIPKAMNEKLAERALEIGVSKNAFILNLINQELSKSKIDTCESGGVR